MIFFDCEPPSPPDDEIIFDYEPILPPYFDGDETTLNTTISVTETRIIDVLEKFVERLGAETIKKAIDEIELSQNSVSPNN